MRTFARTTVGVTLALALWAVLGADEARAQRSRRGLLSLEDARLFYEIVGSGDPIIVVHGGQEAPDPVLAVDRRPEEEKLEAGAGVKLTPLWAEFVDEEAEPSIVYVT